jgi:hypothetical protein
MSCRIFGASCVRFTAALESSGMVVASKKYCRDMVMVESLQLGMTKMEGGDQKTLVRARATPYCQLPNPA